MLEKSLKPLMFASFISMVTEKETNYENKVGNWLYAVGNYRTWATANVYKKGGTYTMVQTYHLSDNYDWELDNGLGGGFLTDREMALLHRYGRAKEYEMVGSQEFTITWDRGQRIGTGVSLPGVRR